MKGVNTKKKALLPINKLHFADDFLSRQTIFKLKLPFRDVVTKLMTEYW